MQANPFLWPRDLAHQGPGRIAPYFKVYTSGQRRHPWILYLRFVSLLGAPQPFLDSRAAFHPTRGPFQSTVQFSPGFQMEVLYYEFSEFFMGAMHVPGQLSIEKESLIINFQWLLDFYIKDKKRLHYFFYFIKKV